MIIVAYVQPHILIFTWYSTLLPDTYPSKDLFSPCFNNNENDLISYYYSEMKRTLQITALNANESLCVCVSRCDVERLFVFQTQIFSHDTTEIPQTTNIPPYTQNEKKTVQTKTKTHLDLVERFWNNVRASVQWERKV